MNRYATGLFLFAIFILVFGFINGKISMDSFQYISIPGLFYAVLKSLVMVLVLLLAVAATIPAFFLDLLLLIFTNYDFPILSQIWNISWDGLTIGWFWTETSGSSLFFGALILLILSSYLMRSTYSGRWRLI